ncbi:MAG: hypothetical protein J5648_09340 [Lachnospiraceae bacterium]|nr:hypothetical protein [Lachnospiraceae bacterium]
MAESGKKKFIMKRKPFIITIIVVCVVLAIAEVLLLTKVFSKKNNEKKNDKQSNQQSGQQSGTPAPAGTEDMNNVWKVARVFVQYEGCEKELYLEYEYDESGREKQMTGSYNQEKCYQNVKKQDGVFVTGYIALCGEDGNLVDNLAALMSGYKKDYSFAEKFDTRGNLIEVSKVYNQTEEAYERWEFEFDDQDRAVKMKDYSFMNGGLELFRYFIFQYDSFDRVKCMEEYWTQDGDRITSKLEYDYANNKMIRTFYEGNYYGDGEETYCVAEFSGKQRETLKDYRGEKCVGDTRYLVLKGNFPSDSYFIDNVFPFGRKFCTLTAELTYLDGSMRKEDSWEYDQQGRPIGFSEYGNEISLSYDEQGYCISADVTTNGAHNNYEYSYDERGNLTEVSFTEELEGGEKVTYFYEWVKLPNR